MRKIVCFLLPLVSMLAGCTRETMEPAAARPVMLDKEASVKIVREIERDRDETRKWLQESLYSYLAAVDRVSFNNKTTLTVGSAAGNDLRILSGDIEPRHLRVTVEGERFRVECIDAKARFKVKEEEKREAIVGPSYIHAGRFALRLSHQNFPALILFDPKSPRFRQYKGIEYFPIDLSYRYEVRLNRYPDSKSTEILSTRGNSRKAERVGWVEFMVGDTPCRLEATHLIEPGSAEGTVDIYFRDTTSGKESYPVGRYVDMKKLENGNYLLDFNMAYNPACAFSEFYNCPIPPKANTLKVPVRAGEKNSHYHLTPMSLPEVPPDGSRSSSF